MLASGGYWVLLAIVGAACGLLNTLASSGSAVSLPILLMLGLPEGSANATNRLPVMVGSVMASFSFARRGQMDWRAAAKLVPAAALGSLVGALWAEMLPNRQIGIVITGAVLIALVLLFTKIKQALAQESTSPPEITLKSVGLMFFVGAWLGFIVLDGATYLLLVLILVCGYALPHANALKVLLIAVTTLIPIVLFSGAGEVVWAEGGMLALGSIAGGHAGAHFSNHPAAKIWAFRLLVAVIILELVHLGWHYTAPWRAAT
ncbi:MAG: sulfite exporter TauE/SafE family protein [Xanthobacteraceae bacterium]